MNEPRKVSVQTKTWPQLYATASTGKIKTWQTWTTQNIDDTATIWTRHGYIDSKLQDKPKIISIGKNIGKSNQTTPFEQACAQAQSTFNSKIKKKYITEIPDGANEPNILLPMLAKNFRDYAHHVNYPCVTEAKFNGVRCLTEKISEEQIRYTSKLGNEFNTINHLTKHLLSMMKINEIFDGELYVHGWTFQQIIRRVKKVREDSHLLQYWVYDIANKDPTMHRIDRYTAAIPEDHPLIKRVPIKMAANKKDIYRLHDEYVQQGFEGIIIRNINASYEFDHRSMNLQKYKHFIDEEFIIIGAEAEKISGISESTGLIVTALAVVWICETKDKQKFNVRPRGSAEQRIAWYANCDNTINKKLTVRYQELSEDGVPIFPVGISLRDYE